jgi:chromate reductase
MKILAISGSVRQLSTNTALLRAMQTIAPQEIIINIFDGIGDLPIFSSESDSKRAQ